MTTTLTREHVDVDPGLLDAVRQTFSYVTHQMAVTDKAAAARQQAEIAALAATLAPESPLRVTLAELVDKAPPITWVPYSDKRATGFVYEGGLWVPPLHELGPPLMAELEALLGEGFAVVVMQAYQDGEAVTEWHGDANYATEAILSLGASRHFLLRVNDDEATTEDLLLAHGDIIMFPAGWHHSVPADPDVHDERCSLVFRAGVVQ